MKKLKITVLLKYKVLAILAMAMLFAMQAIADADDEKWIVIFDSYSMGRWEALSGSLWSNTDYVAVTGRRISNDLKGTDIFRVAQYWFDNRHNRRRLQELKSVLNSGAISQEEYQHAANKFVIADEIQSFNIKTYFIKTIHSLMDKPIKHEEWRISKKSCYQNSGRFSMTTMDTATEYKNDQLWIEFSAGDDTIFSEVAEFICIAYGIDSER